MMIIAVCYENGMIFGHFGKTENFKFYETEGNNVRNSYVKNTDGKGHSELVGFLKEAGAEVLICGSMGMGAFVGLTDQGIRVYPMQSGFADHAVNLFLEGKLTEATKENADTFGFHQCGCHQ